MIVSVSSDDFPWVFGENFTSPVCVTVETLFLLNSVLGDEIFIDGICCRARELVVLVLATPWGKKVSRKGVGNLHRSCLERKFCSVTFCFRILGASAFGFDFLESANKVGPLGSSSVKPPDTNQLSFGGNFHFSSSFPDRGHLGKFIASVDSVQRV